MAKAQEENELIVAIIEAHLEFRKGKGSFTLNEIAKMYAGSSFQSRLPLVRKVVIDWLDKGLLEPLDDIKGLDPQSIPGPTRFRRKRP